MLSSQGSNNSIFGIQQALLIAYGVGGHIRALYIIGFFLLGFWLYPLPYHRDEFTSRTVVCILPISSNLSYSLFISRALSHIYGNQ